MINDRHQLIKAALKRARGGSGSNLNALHEAHAGYSTAGLVPDLGSVSYVIVGGLATACYMPRRMTLDTDILVSLEDLPPAESALTAANCTRTGTLASVSSTWRMPGGRALDVIALDNHWVHDAIHSAHVGENGLPYIALPYLVLMKLESGRLQDLADISRMMGFADNPAVDRTRSLVNTHRPNDLEDLEGMIRLGKLEHEQGNSTTSG
ncbi:MAG: hypothetical protein R6V03_08535 [Kiritimatiellia bacterium]